MKPKLIVALVSAACAALLLIVGVNRYNRLVTLEETLDGQWGQVENVYQRRADLVPNLVETVKGAAAFEQQTLTQVIEARSRALTVGAGSRQGPRDPASFESHQQAQDQLSSALSRLMVVVEQYPQLGATAAYRDLMTQLEGTENRIAVERMRFNELAALFNGERRRFPTILITKLFGDRFSERAYFKARPGAESAPQVRFP
jgi:LemA protein